jgi:hypothetical protein
METLHLINCACETLLFFDTLQHDRGIRLIDVCSDDDLFSFIFALVNSSLPCVTRELWSIYLNFQDFVMTR